MTANKPSDAIHEVMQRRIKELERDRYNEDFLRCFRNGIEKIKDGERYAHANKVQAEEIKEMRERLAIEQRKYESRVEQHEECVARMAEAERDAARYRWLRTRINWRDSPIGIATNRTAPIIETSVRHWTHVDLRNPKDRPSHEHIDEYIDAQLTDDSAPAVPVDGLREALFKIWRKLDTDRVAWEHDHDDGEDCRACEYEALRELARVALGETATSADEVQS